MLLFCILCAVLSLQEMDCRWSLHACRDSSHIRTRETRQVFEVILATRFIRGRFRSKSDHASVERYFLTDWHR